MGERLVHDDAQLVEVDGLAEVVERAPSHRLHRRADGGVRGEHDHLRARGDLAQPAEHIEATHAREAQVDDGDVRTRLLGATEAFLAGQGKNGPVAKAIQIDRHGLGLDLFVLDDQDEPGHRSGLSRTGSVTTKVAPPVRPLATLTNPPWDSANFLATASPSPLP